jgi:mRNA-degrading endonuclease RelE of RelBE toxin-antitoxin system
MTGTAFSVRVTPQCERLIRKLNKRHRDFINQYETASNILSSDPYKHTRSHQIKKLETIPAGEGAWRLRLGRWRFRYDIWERQVELSYCGLRREETHK